MQIQSQDKNQQQSQPMCDTRSAWQAFSAGQHLLLSHFPYSHYWLTASPPPPLLIISVSAKRHSFMLDFSSIQSLLFKSFHSVTNQRLYLLFRHFLLPPYCYLA